MDFRVIRAKNRFRSITEGMNFFFNKPKEKSRGKPEKNQERAGGGTQDPLSDDALPKFSDTSLLRFVRTTIESKSETTWYSHHAPAPKGESIDEQFLAKDITVEIGAFLQRIPPDLLNAGPHDPERRVHFKAGDLVVHIGQRKPSVLLSSIAKACPEIFSVEITALQDAEIYFPWHCVVEQLSAGYLQAGGKSGIPQNPPDPIESTERGEEAPVQEPGIAPRDSGVVAEEPPVNPDNSAADSPVPFVESPVIESSCGPASVDPDPVELLIQERDIAIRQRDEALVEIERLKVALRHTSEALEAVCQTGIKEKDAG